MKLNYIWLALIIILFPGYAFGKCSEVGTIENDEYFWMESKRKADFCYKRYIHSGYLTVVTLKHKEGKGDYDVRVFSDSGFGNKISSSTATGAKSELLVLQIQEHSK